MTFEKKKNDKKKLPTSITFNYKLLQTLVVFEVVFHLWRY